MYDLLHYTETHNIPEILFQIDFEKTFETISWSLIQNTLSFGGFGTDINDGFCFNKNIKSSVIVIGSISSSFYAAFVHGAMGRRIDPYWGGPIKLFLVPASDPRLV